MEIDYEKLKLAHELASANNIKLWIDIAINAEESHPFTGWIGHCSNANEIHCIDELITKLQELTQPKPKYKVGQKVWVLDDNDICTAFIKHVDEDQYYIFDCRRLDGTPTGLDYVLEYELFASREQLIDAQLKHWYSKKEELLKPYEEKSEHTMDASNYHKANEVVLIPASDGEMLTCHLDGSISKTKVCNSFTKT